ncbi:MAG: four helix bundle protein [Acidobacteriota bacterium]
MKSSESCESSGSLRSQSCENGGTYADLQKFEEIKTWQKAREVTLIVYAISKEKEFAMDFGLRDQIRRASVSIMANIAEGHGRRSDKEFANFLNMSRGSVEEVQSHLYVALDQRYINQECFSKLYDLLEEISRMIMALSQHLRGISH